jgi:hypothetical protein
LACRQVNNERKVLNERDLLTRLQGVLEERGQGEELHVLSE